MGSAIYINLLTWSEGCHIMILHVKIKVDELYATVVSEHSLLQGALHNRMAQVCGVHVVARELSEVRVLQ
jgi:hypothetical protein